jgi:benzoyl-CoA reductase/2-hydroxyglutaryl-CoA dehydratase subunit BcrC/BadD/HgdB
MKADGIVIFCQWGCKQTQGIAFAAKRIFEEHGLPTLVLDGDAADRANEASGQSSTRASAFVEALNERKSGRVPA